MNTKAGPALASGNIELTPVGLPLANQDYRPFLMASLAMATLLGFVYGIEVSAERLLGGAGGQRTNDLVQAHGQVQLLGFAGLFVMGMSLRLMPRFASSRIALRPLVPLTLGLLLAGLLERAILTPWFSGEAHSALMLASSLSVLAGSACFLAITVGTVAVRARRFDASSLAFLCGAILLVLASLVTVFAVIDGWSTSERTLPYLTDNAVLQLELGGFVASFILGVALRAIPQMVGIERPGRMAGVLALCLGSAVAGLAVSLLYLEYVSYSMAVVRLADGAYLSFGSVLLVLVWMTGVLRQAANRIRPASQSNLWLIRSAFAWMLVAALAVVYAGASSLIAEELPSQFEFDAARHALGAGVFTMLIAGMTLMILPEIAAERLGANRQRQLAYLMVVLLNATALLRVAPSLAGGAWTFDQRNLSMAIAGSLAELAMLIFGAYLVRLFLRARND